MSYRHLPEDLWHEVFSRAEHPASPATCSFVCRELRGAYRTWRRQVLPGLPAASVLRAQRMPPDPCVCCGGRSAAAWGHVSCSGDVSPAGLIAAGLPLPLPPLPPGEIPAQALRAHPDVIRQLHGMSWEIPRYLVMYARYGELAEHLRVLAELDPDRKEIRGMGRSLCRSMDFARLLVGTPSMRERLEKKPPRYGQCSYEVLALLEAHGFSSTCPASDAMTAAAEGNAEACRFLADRGHVFGDEEMCQALSSGDVETIRMLADLVRPAWDKDCSLAARAVGSCNVAVVELLIERGAAFGPDSISIAVGHGEYQIVRMLQKVCPKWGGMEYDVAPTPEMVELLRELGCPVPPESCAAVAALLCEDIPMLKALLPMGFSLDVSAQLPPESDSLIGIKAARVLRKLRPGEWPRWACRKLVVGCASLVKHRGLEELHEMGCPLAPDDLRYVARCGRTKAAAAILRLWKPRLRGNEIVAAIKSGVRDTIRALRDGGCPWTGLEWKAVMRHHPRLAQFLLEDIQCPLSDPMLIMGSPAVKSISTAFVWTGERRVLELVIANGGDVTEDAVQTFAWTGKECEAAVACDRGDLLPLLREAGCPWTGKEYEVAILRGLRTLLPLLWEAGCPWSGREGELAAACGYGYLLPRMRKAGCGLTGRECEAAIACGYVDNLPSIREAGCAWRGTEGETVLESRLDVVGGLRMLHALDFPFGPGLVRKAAALGAVGALRYLCRDLGLGFVGDEIQVALRAGHLLAVNELCRWGCPVGDSAELAAQLGYEGTAAMLRRQT